MEFQKKLMAQNFKTNFYGYFGGFYVMVLPPTIMEYKDKGDELYQKIVSCL